jgi:predicted dehydrogenase
VVQVPAFRLVPEFEVVALCARRLERAEAAGQALGISDVSTDWTTFVERDDLDLISICTPVDMHHPQTLAALAAGKHVLVEKPVGLDDVQTKEMLDAAESAGVCHAVCFENRLEPARARVSALVAEGVLGQPYLAAARSGGDYWHPTRGLQSEWMYHRASGGGYLMGMGSHDIDFLCALFGEPEAVCADVRSSVPERHREDGSVLAVDADDTSALVIRMQNGMVASVITTAIALAQSFRAIEVFGSTGSIAIGNAPMGAQQGVIEVARSGDTAPAAEPVELREPRSGGEIPKRRAGASIRSLALMLEDWLPAFSGQPSNVPTLRDGHRVQRIVDGARRSSEGAGWVAL